LSRDWENLTPEQSKYLLHVQPPGDTITMVIRNIIEENNITNAAIIFDDSFVMEYKYRSLLLNVPCRHLINKMRMGEQNVMEHLKLMTKIDLNNIFLLGSPENIARYLTVASSLGMIGKKYSWLALSKVILISIILQIL
jgi:ionotropic glutamate receptor